MDAARYSGQRTIGPPAWQLALDLTEFLRCDWEHRLEPLKKRASVHRRARSFRHQRVDDRDQPTNVLVGERRHERVARDRSQHMAEPVDLPTQSAVVRDHHIRFQS